MHIDQKIYDRFIARAWPDPNSGCWLWSGSCQPCKTGTMKIRKRTVRAAVFSYVWHKGPVPEGKIVHHICNMRFCVNPDHLEPATRRENVIDGHWRRGKPDHVISLEEVLRRWRLSKQVAA